MNEEALDDLYREFVETGYRQSKEDFKILLSENPEAFKDGYQSFTETGYNGSEDDFATLLGVSNPLKKKVQAQPKVQNASMESSLGDGSLESQESKLPSDLPELKPFSWDEIRDNYEINPETGQIAPKVEGRDTRQDDYVAPQVPGMYPDEFTLEQYNKQLAADFAKTQLERQLDKKAADEIRYYEDLAETERKNLEQLGLERRIDEEDFQRALSTIDKNLIDQEEEDVVKFLTDQFKGYGFLFEETGAGDAMIVSAPNGKTIEIDLDPFQDATEIAESQKLRQFMMNNATLQRDTEPTDDVSKAFKARDIRKVGRRNADGSESTVKMMSFEADGKFYAAPTLFPIDPNNYSDSPDTWMELSPEEAIATAKERGEIFEFDTEAEAQAFAEGSWKDVDISDLEAKRFYEKRGLDYNREKKILDEYMEATDVMYFLDPDRLGYVNQNIPFNQENLTAEQAKLIKGKEDKFYLNGELREDVNILFEEAEKVADRLSESYLREDAQLAREEFDLYLNKRHQEEAGKAIRLNQEVKAIQDDILQESLLEFGVEPKALIGVDFKDPVKKNKADKLLQKYEESQVYKQYAADKYYKANTYYDMKHNKNATKEFADNWDAFTTEVASGWNKGKAGEVILAGAMFPEILGGYDLDDPDSTKKMAEKLVMYLQKEPDKVARVMSRYSSARTSDEIRDAIWSNPLEWSVALAGSSISQMLPYGSKIVASTVATGTATGAALGSAGFVTGPGGVATTGAGAAAGFTYGFRTGMAATSLALEYTNEMMAAIQNYCAKRGSSSLNPDMVAEALQTKEVWDEGRERGLARGIPIAMVDLFMGGLAGKIFKTASIASKGTRIAALAAERVIADPIAEGIGEYAAQVSVGDKINYKDIYAEMGGAMGNNTSNMGINLARETIASNNIELASLLTDIGYISDEVASDSRISEWGNNMERLGQISPEQNQRIQENVGLRKTAAELLSTGRFGRRFQGKESKALTKRVMTLLAAKEELSSTTNRRELFSKKISEINEELSDIVSNKKLRPNNEQTILAGTGLFSLQEQANVTDIRGGLPTYTIKPSKFRKAREVSKKDFVDYINGLDTRNLLKLNATIRNDEEVSQMVANKIMEAKLGTTTEQAPVTTENSVDISNGTVETAPQEGVVQDDVQADVQETVAEDGVSSKTLEETDAVVDNQQAAGAMGAGVETTTDVDTEVDMQTEISDLESKIQEDETGAEPKVDFRLKSAEELNQEFEPSADETQDITRQINQIESGNVSTEIQSGVRQRIDVEELNSRIDNSRAKKGEPKRNKPFKIVNMSVVKGVPSVFTISDQLTTGDVVNPSTGNTIDNLKGGLGFTGTVGNEQAAWANTNKSEAADLLAKAKKVYTENKELFDSWWKANPEYNGLVPMNVVKMGEGSILSNEATFRVLLDNLTKIPAKNKKKAVKALRESLKKVIADRQKSLKEGGKAESTMKQYAKQLKNAEAALNSLKGVNTIEDILSIEKVKQLSLPARRELIELIGYSQPNRANETKGVSAPNSEVSKVLLEGMDEEARKLINLSVITDLITDKQMANVPQRSIVAIQGIDVFANEPIETTHPNYPFGVKGRTIGILDESVAIQDAYGVAFNNALVGLTKAETKPKRVTETQAQENQAAFDKAEQKVKEGQKLTKKDKTALEQGRLVEGQIKASSMGQILTETIGVQNGLPGLMFIGAIAEGNIDNVNKLINFMNESFPSVNISTDAQTFNTVIESDGVKKYLKGDEVIYGVTVDGDIYINPDVHNSESSLFNTAIHEMGHVWTDYLQVTKKGREIYKKGAELVQQTEEFKKQLKIFNGDVNKATNETMAILIGNKGQTITDAAIKSKFKEWLLGMWNYIKSQFKLSADLTAEDIQNMKLDDFLGTALADIFSGKAIKLSDNQLKKLKNPEVAFRQSMSMQSIIQTGRANGFSDASIRVVLQNRGFKAKDITDAMTVQIDLVTQMPKEFGNVEGGANVGVRLFNEVRDGVNAFSTEGPRGGRSTTGVRTKTFAEIREKAIELMKQNPIWQVQDEQVQMELLNAFDRVLGIRANPRVTQQIADIRAKLKQRRIGAKNLVDAQRAMRMRIRKLLPKSKNYSSTSLNRLLKLINETTDKNFEGQMTKVLDIVEQQRTLLRNQVILKIQDLVEKKAKTLKTQSGKRRSAGLDAIGQSYFAEVKKVLRAAIKQDAEAMAELQESINEDLYSEGIQAIAEGRQPSRKQQEMIDRQTALDTFGDVLTMELEDVNALFEEVKLTRAESIARLNNRREMRRAEVNALKDIANNQMRSDYREMYDEAGNPLGQNALNQRREKIRVAFLRNGVFTGLANWAKQFKEEGRKYKVNPLSKFFYNNLSHLGTITNILDRGKKGFFTKFFYDNLNIMDENNLQGVRNTTNIINAITQSVVGKNWMDWKYSLGTDIIQVKLKESKTGNTYDSAMNKDQAMRVIALSMNDVQRKKLLAQGITEETLEDLKDFVGYDQVEIIERVVDFLSNEYFEQTNAVYSQVNDVNLNYVENYFPTRTLSQEGVTPAMLADSEIQKIFTADFSPSLKERTDKTSDVLLGLSFTDVLEEHTKQMEKYKAYALGVKQIDAVLRDEGMRNILRETGVEQVFKTQLNYAINPDAGPELKGDILDVIQRKYTGFALAFKLIQIPKQMSSFIQAYDKYADGKTKIPGSKLLSFTLDYAMVLARLRSEIKEAREVSATFDNRIKMGLEGDIFGLESGTRTVKKGTASQGKMGRFRRGFQKATGIATVAGDILGVLGYKAVYNRAKRDGKSDAEALRLFNDYNATQQTRRATEKNIMQQSRSWQTRFFTTFGSTLFLQMNQVYQSMNNMTKDIARGKLPQSKDVKTFALNYAVANVLFTMASYSASLINGNSDDRDRAWKAIRDALYGKNLIYQMPLAGAALEVLDNKISGSRKPVSEGVNPFTSLYFKVSKAYDGLSAGSILKASQPFIEIMIGAQLDSPIALIKLIGGDTSEDNVLQTLGVSKSYRPGYGQKKGEGDLFPKETTNKSDLRLLDEETYNEIYGKESDYYEQKKDTKEINKELKDEIKDALK